MLILGGNGWAMPQIMGYGLWEPPPRWWGNVQLMIRLRQAIKCQQLRSLSSSWKYKWYQENTKIQFIDKSVGKRIPFKSDFWVPPRTDQLRKKQIFEHENILLVTCFWFAFDPYGVVKCLMENSTIVWSSTFSSLRFLGTVSPPQSHWTRN